MAGTTVVTPDLLRSTKQKIEARLQEAATIAQQYLSGHENILSAGWKGDAGTTSLSTAGEVEHDLQQIMTGGQRLAHGLAQTAVLMEHLEQDASHSLSNLSGMLGGAQST